MGKGNSARMTDPPKFREWFEAQHGKRPGAAKIDDAELAERVNWGRAAERLLARRLEWDARFESALYAWQAKPR